MKWRISMGIRYEFTKDCFIGVEAIDQEHERLFEMINQGMELVSQDENVALCVAKELIMQLRQYANTHFAHEEAYMEQIQDAELERQKKEHAEFREYMNQQDVSKLTEENVKGMLTELFAYLAKWLYRHILGSDMMIGQHKIIEEAKEKEDVFAFTDKFKTGIELVDEEHRKLFEIIKETNDLIDQQLLHDKYDAIVHIIEELKEYTRLHFSDEEAYMKEIGYAGLEAQQAAHIAFVDKLNQINLDEVDENQQDYLYELIDYLLSWLSTHILKMDKKIPVQ